MASRTSIRSVFLALAGGLLLSGLLRATPPAVDVVKSGPEAKELMKVRTESGTAEVEARAVRVDLQFPNGDKGEDVLLVLHEPKSGLYWWEYERVDPASPEKDKDRLRRLVKDYAFFLAGDRLVGFRLMWTKLLVREGRQRQASADKAVQSILQVMKRNLKDRLGDPIPDRSEVVVSKPLGIDFFRGTKLVAQMREARLLDVARRDAEWTARLEGPDGEPASVVLSDAYAVRRAVRDGRTVFPNDEKER